MRKISLYTLFLFVPFSFCGEKPNNWSVSEYSKQMVDIPMRDGIKLHTHIYIPEDRSQAYAFLINRTPYSIAPYDQEGKKYQLGPGPLFEKRGFIFVYQDVRGRFMSEGDYVNMRPFNQSGVNENTDTYDTIEWLLNHISNHNGKVGMWGISYPGFYVSMGMINSHPALVACSPQAPIADWFWDDVHHNGAFSLQLSFTFLYPFGQKRDGLVTRWPYPFEFENPNRYEFFKDLGPLSNVNKKHFHGDISFWNDIIEHPNYDAFWKQRNILPNLINIRCSVLTVGGFFDAEDLYGAIATYESIESQNPGIENSLVMGPWSHGAWSRGAGDSLGDAQFGSATAEYYQKDIEFPFFIAHLYNEGTHHVPEARIFETGSNRWREFDAWPPKHTQPGKFYLHGNGKLTSTPEKGSGNARDFQSNPRSPVPYTTENQVRWGRKFMAEDQRFLKGREDILVFETEPLMDDMTLAGPLKALLWVSTSRSDADWVVKLIDVYPGETENSRGKELMVRWEILRGRFRNSFSEPEPFIPYKVTPLTVRLLDILHTFKAGHRVMVHIQSSFFPFFDINPQTYVDNIFKAKKWDFKKATHKVYMDAEFPSRIEFSLLDSKEGETSRMPTDTSPKL